MSEPVDKRSPCAESAAPSEPDGESVMRQSLASAVETHPALWAEMGRLWRLELGVGAALGARAFELEGMVRALSIVGGFDPKAIKARLMEDFG